MTLEELRNSLNKKFTLDFQKLHVLVKFINLEGKEDYQLIVGVGYIEEPECIILITNETAQKMIEEGKILPENT